MAVLRALRLILWAAVVAAALGAAWIFLIAPRLHGDVRDNLGRGDYVLEATDGTEITEASLKGHPTGVFFGFTHCPDVCPTTLGDIGVWMDELGPGARDLRFWFVTVDPERDSVDMLRDYVSWTPGVVGAGGSRAEVDKAIKAFKVFASKVPLSNGDYTMDHSAYVMLFDRDGRFDGVVSYQEAPESVVPKLRALVAGG
jgi:protein SCO1/2